LQNFFELASFRFNSSCLLRSCYEVLFFLSSPSQYNHSTKVWRMGRMNLASEDGTSSPWRATFSFWKEILLKAVRIEFDWLFLSIVRDSQFLDAVSEFTIDESIYLSALRRNGCVFWLCQKINIVRGYWKTFLYYHVLCKHTRYKS